MKTGARSGVKGDEANQPTLLTIAEVASILRLDPIELEQCYLALYSLYTTHMGQGKEAAQVSTKYMISDLQKEAAAWNAMPPPSLVAPIVTVNTVDHDVAALQASARCLSGAARKPLLG